MGKDRAKATDWRQSRWLPVASVCLALTLLAGAIAIGTWYLRDRLRAQVIGRDGEVLKAVAMMQYLAEQEADPSFSLADPGDQLQVLLKASFLDGVMGTRLYDRHGHFITSFPEYVRENRLAPQDLDVVRNLDPVSRYYAQASLSDIFLSQSPEVKVDRRSPILEVIIPFYVKDDRQLLGAAQIIINGREIAKEFLVLDKTLTRQAILLFVVCGVLMAGGLVWAFTRLERLNEELSDQSENLLKANQELAMMARTSAVGAVAANLMHGLKSPLFGLLNLFAAWRASEKVGEKMEWNTAVETARRMQAMINGVMDFVREQEGLENHEVTLEELLDEVGGKIEPLASEYKVGFQQDCAVDAVVSSRVANLVTLILINLIHNAIEATPAGRQVKLQVRRRAKEVEFEIADEGHGLKPGLEKQLFQPCESTKENGSGLGLAICKQLARHIGADIKLQKNSAEGCVFSLSLPPQLLPAHQPEA